MLLEFMGRYACRYLASNIVRDAKTRVDARRSSTYYVAKLHNNHSLGQEEGGAIQHPNPAISIDSLSRPISELMVPSLAIQHPLRSRRGVWKVIIRELPL